MYQAPRKAKRLYFDVIPRNVDDYFGLLDRYPEQTEEQRYHNPVWHIHNGQPPSGGLPISFSMLLNLASVVNAEAKDVLWGFINRYAREATPDNAPLLDELVWHALAYYRDFVKPAKSYRLPTDAERPALAELARWLREFEQRSPLDQASFEQGCGGDPAGGLRDRQAPWLCRQPARLVPGALRDPARPDRGAALWHLRRVLRPGRHRRPDRAGPGRPADRPAGGLSAASRRMAPRAARPRSAPAGWRSMCSIRCWASGGRSTTCSPATRSSGTWPRATARMPACWSRPRSAGSARSMPSSTPSCARRRSRSGCATCSAWARSSSCFWARRRTPRSPRRWRSRAAARASRAASPTRCSAGSRARARRRSRRRTPPASTPRTGSGRAGRRPTARSRARAIAAAHLVEPPLDLTVKEHPEVWARRLDAVHLYGNTLRRPAGGVDRGPAGLRRGRLVGAGRRGRPAGAAAARGRRPRR